MKVKVARTAGFCMGVRRAVNLTLDAAAHRDPPINTLGPLIHNPQVVDMLEKRGVGTARDIPDSGTVVIRSHGVGPQTKRKIRKQGLEISDATCTRVARVHAITAKHHKKGYQVVVLGDKGHAEVEGIVGYADGEAFIVSSPDEVKELPEAGKVCLVSQTTQERERFAETAASLRKRYPELSEDDLVIADTICDSTRNRQDEVRRLCKEVDAMVVVGGKHSANTKRLAEVAEEEGKPAFLVETEEDIDEEALSKFKKVGLTAGASTPNWMIRRIHDRLRKISPRRGPVEILSRAVEWLVLGNLYVAAGAGALTFTAARIQGTYPDPREVIISMSFVFAVHTLILLSDPKALALNVPARARAFSEFRAAWIAAGALAMALAVALAFSLGLWSGVIIAGLTALSLSYRAPLPRGLMKILRAGSLADVPASKDIFMAVGWSVLVVVLPIAAHPPDHVNFMGAATAVVIVGGLVFVRAMLRDFRDIQADRLIGHETLPIVLGPGRTRKLLYGALVFLAATAVGATLLGWMPSPLGYLLAVPVAYSAACVPLFTRETLVQGFEAELVIDAVFLLAGLTAFFS